MRTAHACVTAWDARPGSTSLRSSCSTGPFHTAWAANSAWHRCLNMANAWAMQGPTWCKTTVVCRTEHLVDANHTAGPEGASSMDLGTPAGRYLQLRSHVRPSQQGWVQPAYCELPAARHWWVAPDDNDNQGTGGAAWQHAAHKRQPLGVGLQRLQGAAGWMPMYPWGQTSCTPHHALHEHCHGMAVPTAPCHPSYGLLGCSHGKVSRRHPHISLTAYPDHAPALPALHPPTVARLPLLQPFCHSLVCPPAVQPALSAGRPCQQLH